MIAYATAQKGKEKETFELLSGLVAPTRAEKGCINYDLHQSLEDPRLFVFYENWENQEVLDRHFQTSHVLSAMEKSAKILTEPVQITLLKQI